MSWYRTYRPSAIHGLHLTQVKNQLEDLFSRAQVPQVWLLTGPKGTGKTSTARIVAAMLNSPQNEAVVRHLFFGDAKPKSLAFVDPDPSDDEQRKILQGQSYVVQEWDAASHRGIDDVRALKEQVALPPQLGLMSIYILDEVHMLTTEAFNALLKLLEEPPQHAIFMLATTERHKVPETIISRATVIQFTQANNTELIAALQHILDEEGKSAEPAALTTIAEAANGSFRDAVKFLEQVSQGRDQVTQADVAGLGSSISQEIAALVQAVVSHDAKQVVAQVSAWRAAQLQPDFIYRQLLSWLHDQIMIGVGAVAGQAQIKQQVAIFLLQELQVLPGWATTPIPLLPLEVKLLDVIQRAAAKKSPSTPPMSSGGQPVKLDAPRPAVSLPTTELHADTIPVSPEVDPEPQILANQVVAAPAAVSAEVVNVDPVSLGTAQLLLEQWEKFVDIVQEKNSTIAAVLRSAKPLETGVGSAKVAVFYKFHYEQLKQPKFQKIFEESAVPLTGGMTKLEFVLHDASKPSAATPSLTALAEQVLV